MGLFKPKWMSKNAEKALAAIDGIEDEETLRLAARTATLGKVRVKAAEKIGDQRLFKALATGDTDPYVCTSMALHVTDIDFLELFVKRPGTKMTGEIRDRIDALKWSRRNEGKRALLAEIPNMDDRDRLVEIAISDPSQDVRSFTRYPIYGAPPPKTIEAEMREAAVDRLAELGDDFSLAGIVRSKYAQQSGVASRAATKIKDQDILFELGCEDTGLRDVIVGCITDRELLDQLASTQPCLFGHDWECVDTHDDESDDWRRRTYVYRCTRCGAMRTEIERI